MSAPRKATGGREGNAAKAPSAKRGARGFARSKTQAELESAPRSTRLPKPPQGHAGFKRKIERELPRRQGTAPRYSNRNSKQQMLQAALEAASERGYESMRISEITDPIGVTRQAFYAHFRDKRHCMAEALDPKLGAIERMAASLSESDPRSAARIAQLLDDLIAERFGSTEGTRGRILSAIGELLLEGRTLHEITIGQIVKAAHIPQGDFYRQFSTKRECFAVFYERLLDELMAEVEERIRSEECSAKHSGHDLPECSAEHTGNGLPALLRSLGEVLGSDPERLRVLVVESAHLPESQDPGRVGAWRGSLGEAISSSIASSQDVAASDPKVRWLTASAVEVTRSAALSPRAGDLPKRFVELGSGYGPSPLEGSARPRAA